IEADIVSEIHKYVTGISDQHPDVQFGDSQAQGHFCGYLAAHRQVDVYKTIRLDQLHRTSPTCRLCRVLVETIDQQEINQNWEHTTLTIVPTYYRDTFFVTGLNPDTGAVEHSSLFFLFTPSEFSATADFPFMVGFGMEVVPGDTSTDSSLAWAKEKIKTCISDHACSHGARASSLLTRVLDVSYRSGHEGTVKLLATDRQDATYACLSHCWGDTSRMLKTTTETLSSHLNGIAIADLPRSFQDAVDITRRLGIRYLWVDSLCIIQDCKKDWDSEAQRMAEIYEGSHVTIATTDSLNGDGGCYRRPTKEINHGTIWYTGDDGEKIAIYSRQPHDHFKMKMDGREGSGGDESSPPLWKRGWVYQERLLSLRVLHFCRRDLLSECRAGNQCQCGKREPEVGPKETFAQLLTGDAALDSRQSHRGWWAMTRQYSQLRLTFEKDVLLALSGIARRIGDTRPTEDDYLCGIWKSTLPYGLLWYVPDPNLESPAGSYPQRASDPRVPSWSWASVVGPIRWWLPSPDFALFAAQASPISVRCLWFKPDMGLVLRPTDEGKFERIGLVHGWRGGELLTSQQLRQLVGTIEVV
ncbi:uncharacterized protein PG986_004137, partial [Apiospora aurea]